jgi:hypothetical protein
MHLKRMRNNSRHEQHQQTNFINLCHKKGVFAQLVPVHRETSVTVIIRDTHIMKKDKICVSINCKKKTITRIRTFEFFFLDEEKYSFNDFDGIVYKTKIQIQDKSKPMFIENYICFKRKNLNQEILIMTSQSDEILFRTAQELHEMTNIPNLVGDIELLRKSKQIIENK